MSARLRRPFKAVGNEALWPTARHSELSQEMFGGGHANLVPNAHRAAIALESGCKWSTGNGFAGFPRLRGSDPVSG